MHYDEYVKGRLYPEGQRLVREALDAGFPVAILSSTNSIVARPVADELGIREILGTKLELDASGRFTGRITGTYGAREGKTAIATEWAAAHSVTLADFAYYGDSVNDIDILRAVGHPYTVNPATELRELALKNEWPVLNWQR